MSQSQKHISTLTLLNQATYLILLFLVKSLQGMIVVFNEGICIILIICIFPHTTKKQPREIGILSSKLFLISY